MSVARRPFPWSMLALVWIALGSLCEKESERFPCPEGAALRPGSGLCECVEADADGVVTGEGQRLLVGGWGVPCAACENTDLAGETCVCDDYVFLNSREAYCQACPGSCDDLSCVPPGCVMNCPGATCGSGESCGAAGVCLTCKPGMCGGDCGRCSVGSTCLDGLCAPFPLCCVDEFNAPFRGRDYCLITFGYSYEGGSCSCTFQEGSLTTTHSGRVTGFGSCP